MTDNWTIKINGDDSFDTFERLISRCLLNYHVNINGGKQVYEIEDIDERGLYVFLIDDNGKRIPITGFNEHKLRTFSIDEIKTITII